VNGDYKTFLNGNAALLCIRPFGALLESLVVRTMDLLKLH
jgi:hypothetical protein